MSRENPEDNFKRFPVMMPPSLSERIEDYRAEFRPVPAKGDAMRDLMELGLETYWAKKKKLQVHR